MFKLIRFVICVCAVMLLTMSAVLTPHAQAASKTTLTDLPSAAQSLVSTTLGREDARFQFQPTADGYTATNAHNTLRADFSNAGMRVQTDGAQWTFALRGVGYGEALQAVNAVAPTASANRLEYAHEALTEWFVNGPAGLEQGWTLTSFHTS